MSPNIFFSSMGGCLLVVKWSCKIRVFMQKKIMSTGIIFLGTIFTQFCIQLSKAFYILLIVFKLKNFKSIFPKYTILYIFFVDIIFPTLFLSTRNVQKVKVRHVVIGNFAMLYGILTYSQEMNMYSFVYLNV